MPNTTNTIYFFHGEDSYSIHQKIKFWTDQFTLKHGGDMNIEIIEGKTLLPKEFSTNLQAMPFLAEKRLTIVKDFMAAANADTQKIIAEILDNIPDFCVLVFTETTPPDKRTTLYKKLQKIAKVEEFNPLSPAQLTNWVLDQVTKRKGKTTQPSATETTSPSTTQPSATETTDPSTTQPSATGPSITRPEAEFLAQRVGPNLWQLSNEIDKLISATGQNAPITKQLIEDLVAQSLSSSIFRLTDSIAAKNRKASLAIFKTLIDSGEDLMMVFYMIVRHFRILIQAHYLVNNQNASPQDIARKLKQHPFVAQTASNQSKNFTQEKLKTIYQNLLEIDKNFKTGGIKITSEDNRELLLEIERLILSTTL